MRDKVDGPEPDPKRRPGLVHHRARSDRGLVIARLALEQMPFGTGIAFEVATGGTNESPGPLQLEEVIPAGRLGSEPSLEWKKTLTRFKYTSKMNIIHKISIILTRIPVACCRDGSS